MEERKWRLFWLICLIQDIANGGNGRAEVMPLRTNPSHPGHRKRQIRSIGAITLRRRLKGGTENSQAKPRHYVKYTV